LVEDKQIAEVSMDSFLVEKLSEILQTIDQYREQMAMQGLEGHKALPWINERLTAALILVSHKLEEDDIKKQMQYEEKISEFQLYRLADGYNSNKKYELNPIACREYKRILIVREMHLFKLLDKLGLGLKLKTKQRRVH
jgi:hypothetical protein